MLWADGKTLYKKLETTRMGAGLSASGLLSDFSRRATVQAVSKFCDEARRAGAHIFAFATAAVRSARNGNVLCAEIKTACGIEVDVVSGEVEAALGFTGALGDGDGGIVDIGGASTEVVFRGNGQTTFSVSMDLGAVKLFDLCHDEKRLLDREIDAKLKALDSAIPTGDLYAVGGTAATLACIATRTPVYVSSVSGARLGADFVAETADRLLSLSAQERKKIVGMEEKRADIIAGGAYLLCKVIEKLGVNEVIFSDADNLEGYLRTRVLGKDER